MCPRIPEIPSFPTTSTGHLERKFLDYGQEALCREQPWRNPGSNLRHQIASRSEALRFIDDLQNYCLGTRRGIAADRGRPAVGFVYIPNGKLVHFIFSLWPFSSENHAPKGPERKRNKPRCCWPAIFASIFFSENEKCQRLHGRRCAIVHATVLVTNNELCQNLTSGLELGIIWAATFSTHCREQKKVLKGV